MRVRDLLDSTHGGSSSHGHVRVRGHPQGGLVDGTLGVIDCDCMRVTAYTPDGTCVVFQGDRHDSSPHTVYNSRWQEQFAGWLASLTLEGEVR